MQANSYRKELPDVVHKKNNFFAPRKRKEVLEGVDEKANRNCLPDHEGRKPAPMASLETSGLDVQAKAADAAKCEDRLEKRTKLESIPDHQVVIVESSSSSFSGDLNPAVAASGRPARAARANSKPLFFPKPGEMFKDLEENVAVLTCSAPLKTTAEGGKVVAKHKFFMTRKERDEHVRLERIIQMQKSIKEASQLSNNISQATGAALNPFFVARKPTATPSPFQDGNCCTAPSLSDTPWPSAEQVHVGWSKSSSDPALGKPVGIWPAKQLAARQELVVDAASRFIGVEAVKPRAFSMEGIKRNAMLEAIEDCFAEHHVLHHPLFNRLLERAVPVLGDGSLWADLFAPVQPQDIYSAENRKVLHQIVDWLAMWTESPEKFRSTKKTKKKAKKRSDFIVTSDNDYEDCDSDQSEFTLPIEFKPVLLVLGESGSGKSSLVRASAHLAGYNILELNTSDKRNGKVLCDVLAAASTSHTVKTKKAGFCDPNSLDGAERGRTMIVLEDVDMLAEEDKGFWSGLLSVIQTAKCPILLTSTDNPLTRQNPQISSGLGELCNSVGFKYLQCLTKVELELAVTLTAALMGYYIEPAVVDMLCANSTLGQTIHQTQFLCNGFAGAPGGWLRVSSAPCASPGLAVPRTVWQMSHCLDKMSQLFETVTDSVRWML
ncbi:hypothetical protein HDV03_001673 [Kappamyces sp. JEL0829]|nr:hypothetical protein HDV03_001673 [Kappamyces sp. JEL0829]